MAFKPFRNSSSAAALKLVEAAPAPVHTSLALSLVAELHAAGLKAAIEEAATNEVEKVGTLRGGNTGCRLPDGTFAGKCPNQTYLRFLGIVTGETEENRELMFEAGRTNEDAWVASLQRTWPGTILRESETPTSWATSNGTPVTGRPDIVLVSPEGQKVLGLELKLLSSTNTAINVALGKPVTSHVLQAAHYSWQLDIPFELWYTNRTDFEIPEARAWLLKGCPERYLDYRYFKNRQNKRDAAKQVEEKISRNEYLRNAERPEYSRKAYKLVPFTKGFRLEWRRGGSDGADELWCTAIPDLTYGESEHWFRTFVTKSGIRAYFEYVSALKVEEPLNAEIYPRDADGKLANYDLKGYCDLGEACCRATSAKRIGEWVETVRQYVDSQKEKEV